MRKNGTPRRFTTTILSMLLLVAIVLSLSTCQMIQKMKLQQEQLDTPISMDMIDLYSQYEETITIDAPPMKVWDTLADPKNMTYIFSGFDKIIFMRDQAHKLERGMRFGFETEVAGEPIHGNAVVTNFAPGEFLAFALLKPRRNIMSLTMNETKKGKTKVLINITMESFPENMAVRSFEINRSINNSIKKTLKNLKKATLGTVPMGEQQQKAGLQFVEEGLPPFEILHYVHNLPISIQQVWLYFLEHGAYVKLMDEMGIHVSENLVHMLQLPGVGVPYQAVIGPFDFRGIVVVTEMIPNLTLNIAFMHSERSPIHGGGNLRFIRTGEKETQLQVIEYFRIPDEYECKPVDKQALEAGLKKKIEELTQVTAWVTTKKPSRALFKFK